MGFTWDNAAFNRLEQRFRNADKRLIEESVDLVDEATEAGALAQKIVIATSGTGWEDRQGRLDSDKMFDAVSTTPAKLRGDAVEGEFGWVNETEPYFAYQDQGFTHWQTGQDVTPMHSLLSGLVAAREHVRAGIRIILRRI